MTVRISKPEFNLREKITELDKPTGLKGNELMRAETAQDARDLIGTSRRNLIINGDFEVSQRGNYTSSAVTAGHDTYWLDRWMSLKSGTTATVQRVTQTVNGVPQYAARIECTVAGTGIIGFNQRVELSNIPIGKTLTASAMVRTNHPYVGFRTNTFQGTNGDRGVKAIADGNWHRIYWTFDSTGTTNAQGGDFSSIGQGSGSSKPRSIKELFSSRDFKNQFGSRKEMRQYKREFRQQLRQNPGSRKSFNKALRQGMDPMDPKSFENATPQQRKAFDEFRKRATPEEQKAFRKFKDGEKDLRRSSDKSKEKIDRKSKDNKKLEDDDDKKKKDGNAKAN